MKPTIRITAVRRGFDPEAFAAVLVAAALARLREDQKRSVEPPRKTPGGGRK